MIHKEGYRTLFGGRKSSEKGLSFVIVLDHRKKPLFRGIFLSDSERLAEGEWKDSLYMKGIEPIELFAAMGNGPLSHLFLALPVSCYSGPQLPPMLDLSLTGEVERPGPK